MNRFLLQMTALFAMLAWSTASAQDNAGLFASLDQDGDKLVSASEVPAEHARLFERLVRKADKNRDGRLTAEEFAEGLAPSTPPKPIQEEPQDDRLPAKALKLVLLRLDTNKDSQLTRDEAPRELRGAYDTLAEAADGDKDGEVAYRELVQANGPSARAALKIVRQQGWSVDRELALVERQQGDSAARFDSQPDPRAVLRDPKRVAALFRQFDGNGDERLELEEVPDEVREQFARLFRRADRDRSGDLTLKELTGAAQQVTRLMNLTEQFGAAPKPSTSRVTPAKMIAETKPASRSPGAAPIESSDSSAAGAAARLVRRMIERQDANNDGQITKREARGQLSRRFDAADTDGSGVLDSAELARLTKQLEQRLDRAGKSEKD